MRLKLITLTASILALTACSSGYDDPYADAYSGGYDGYGSYGAQAGYGGGFGGSSLGYGLGASTGFGAGTGYGVGASTGFGAGTAGYGVGASTGFGAGTTGYGAGASTGYNAGSTAYSAGASTGYSAASTGYGVGYGTGLSTGYGVAAVGFAPSYGVAQYGGYSGSSGLPWGIEFGIGTDFDIGGDIFPGSVKSATGVNPEISDFVPVSYDDAWENTVQYDVAGTYDLNHNTTLLGRLGYSKADGRKVLVGTATDNTIPAAPVVEDIFAKYSDIEYITLEGGIRKYVGCPNPCNRGIRPYLGATAGLTHVNDVDVTQSSATLIDPTIFTQQYISSGWSPTLSGTIGAEWCGFVDGSHSRDNKIS